MKNAILSHHQMLLVPPLRTPYPKPLLNPSPPAPFFIILKYRLPSTRLSIRRGTTTVTSAAGAPDTQTLPHSAIQRIAEKLRSLSYVEEEKNNQTPVQNAPNNSSPGQIFIPLPDQLPKHRVGHTLDPSWSTPENPVPHPGSGNAIQRFHELRGEAMKEKEAERLRKKGEKKESVPTLAELTLPEAELRRLRTLGLRLKQKLKVGKAGITEGIVNGIHERWRRSELVKIKCEDVCRLNMKRTHDLLESKTGGLAVWRSGSNLILYRGVDYKYPYFISNNITSTDTSVKIPSDLDLKSSKHSGNTSVSSVKDTMNPSKTKLSSRLSCPPLVQGVGSPDKVRFQQPGEAQLAEEADRLLEGLGPRFSDWWGYDPLPVDADLLPAVVPGYRRPFRLLPYGVSPKLTNDEMTILKRLSRPLPCHFALGRNRKLQGLAASMIKLWEKCEIAKIAVKRGVQNTNSAMMAEELKRLTGGILLSRDKEFIAFYRGKDFLPAAVSSAMDEQRKRRTEGERSGNSIPSSAVVAEEHQNWTVECASEDEHNDEDNQRVKVASEQGLLNSTEAAISRTSSKLSMALAKKAKAEMLLAELENVEIPLETELDKEGITEEERYMLRKVGLRMKPFLLLGRRGVFDGTIENMHLHWKYRELVKIITGRKSIEEVHGIARTLETESGGILVAVERQSKGYAIIVYRGKNYQRPSCLRPRTLLSKREAMKRSLEAQRRQSLKLHVLKLTRRIDELELQLAKTQDSKDIQLVEDVNHGLVHEQEIENSQSTEYEMSNLMPASSSLSHTGNPCEAETLDRKEADISSNLEDITSNLENITQQGLQSNISLQSMETEQEVSPASVGLEDITQQGLRSNISLHSMEHKLDMTEQEVSPASVGQKFVSFINMHVEDSQGETSSLTTGAVSSSSESRLSVQKTMGNMPDRNCRTINLSNRERLLLRKQALKMKKRPVFAVGKSNIVTGVGKVLKAHFEKHPLAIVNVKGRAKGTSVREVVFKLEEATGAVLVSQEPSKIILYRGWGHEDEPGQIFWEKNKEKRNYSAGGGGRVHPVVSPELISAIRLECGLQTDRQKESAL